MNKKYIYNLLLLIFSLTILYGCSGMSQLKRLQRDVETLKLQAAGYEQRNSKLSLEIEEEVNILFETQVNYALGDLPKKATNSFDIPNNFGLVSSLNDNETYWNIFLQFKDFFAARNISTCFFHETYDFGHSILISKPQIFDHSGNFLKEMDKIEKDDVGSVAIYYFVIICNGNVDFSQSNSDGNKFQHLYKICKYETNNDPKLGNDKNYEKNSNLIYILEFEFEINDINFSSINFLEHGVLDAAKLKALLGIN